MSYQPELLQQVSKFRLRRPILHGVIFQHMHTAAAKLVPLLPVCASRP
jgi:hypothetical protein